MSEYYNIEKTAKPFDIICKFKKASLIHRAIWYFSKDPGEKWYRYASKTAHTMIYRGDSIISEVTFVGMRTIKMEKYSKKKYEIYVIRPNRRFTKKNVTAFIDNTEGKVKYDFLRLLILMCIKLFGIKSVPDYSKDLMICSEFVSEAFIAGGLKLVAEIEPCDTKPSDILMSEKVTLVEMKE